MNRSAFVHPALFYRGDDEYLAGTVPFVRAGREAGEPVAVAVPPARLALLRDALGPAAAGVTWLDMTEAGRNPGRIIPGVLREFADRRTAGRVRIIGEPIWPGRTAEEYPACAQHEALINMAFEGRRVSILCPYDVAGLDPAVIADARATHPVVIDRGGERASADYAPDRVVRAYNRPFPEPRDAVSMRFDLDALPLVREFACHWGARFGLRPDTVGDLELAVNELAANSCLHGGGSGTARLWAENGHVLCEVRDAGTITDPLAGRRPADMSPNGGRGILMVHHLADLVRVHTGPAGTAIRVYMRR
ncbi:sensor histidine kinase [Actinomadura livida]|uniref:Anti-sigma regulatory factor (Ser/Thr protein kinase) n=1 Tax=Actinomadura livida TaxID=79909 RepID=A0A7W7IDF6_9ACTN|nr:MULTISPECIES: sensor histidine kinase [Actinomadura]MBB4775061.1 anti-sigma regulatory factor (Ser/Thr protein kinase) [Actinomadura catellatispora]GGT87529.1 anti-sigma regulatory factor [Actinomadura livida]